MREQSWNDEQESVADDFAEATLLESRTRVRLIDLLLHPTRNLVGVVKPAVNAAQLESDFLQYHTIPIMRAITKVFARNLKRFLSMVQKYLAESWGNIHYYLDVDVADCDDAHAGNRPSACERLLIHVRQDKETECGLPEGQDSASPINAIGQSRQTPSDRWRPPRRMSDLSSRAGSSNGTVRP